jgi:hypothetical protein
MSRNYRLVKKYKLQAQTTYKLYLDGYRLKWMSEVRQDEFTKLLIRICIALNTYKHHHNKNRGELHDTQNGQVCLYI